MSTGNQSCLRFSLEESVWFQRGQEVAELVSISLDPNITIQENDQYVTIKGSLELTGEYKSDQTDDDGTELEAGTRQIHSVMEREEGYLEFLHRFPVDITIPQNRIESIYDIDISVESFDYDFPERGSLKLSAELAITGLYGDQQHGSDEREEELEGPVEAEEDLEPYYLKREQEVPPELSDLTDHSVAEEESASLKEAESLNELFAPFKAEARKEPEAEQIKENTPELNNVRNEEKVSAFSSQERGEEQQTKQPDMVSHRNEGLAQPKPEEPPLNEGKDDEEAPLLETETETEAETESVSEPETGPELQGEPVMEQSGPIINEKAQQQEESSSSPSQDEPKATGKKISKKKGLSIAEFLARKEESEVAKIRVCIVQQGDTLQHIAERYEVSVQQLLNVNHLGLDQDVAEGQVLYVPAEYAAKGGK
ncbi:stage VI sporulation protein D [Mesobacillus foraminis]|uniref:Stage VI sporulation protein D n=1 Tax=Mesobacillus foraminis TaxID=279826 RepID=A0A4R2BCA0_9BACI|nr:stage VI sporulation protein D [Mesobacillus foraminis]TCN24548.1 stage VI sporulation protein D [Mesobacillus foraminis]